MFERSYSLNFFLQAQNSDADLIRNALLEVGEDITVTSDDTAPDAGTFQVQMRTREPTLVFDVCGQLGRITSVRVDEIMGGDTPP